MRLSEASTGSLAMVEIGYSLTTEPRLTSRSLVVSLLLLALPIGAAVYTLAVFAAAAVSNPAVGAVIESAPLSAFLSLLGLAGGACLLIWPIARLLGDYSINRLDGFDGESLRVVRRGWIAEHASFHEAREFRGIAHRFRTMLSGTTHELLLLHTDPSRSVVAGHAARISDAEIKRLADMLGLPVISTATGR